MARYRMEDGTVVDTDNSSAHWEPAKDFNGSNMIDRSTGSQWHHQTLYRSRKGRYYLVHDSQMQGYKAHAEWISEQEATRWLLHQEIELPEDLAKFAEEVSE